MERCLDFPDSCYKMLMPFQLQCLDKYALNYDFCLFSFSNPLSKAFPLNLNPNLTATKKIPLPKLLSLKAPRSPERENSELLAIGGDLPPFSTENDRITSLILPREEFVRRPLILALLFQMCNKNARFAQPAALLAFVWAFFFFGGGVGKK